jgi:antitoxin (DNA-binding transcriptional repressor) of toxin-antitoxin stability system
MVGTVLWLIYNKCREVFFFYFQKTIIFAKNDFIMEVISLSDFRNNMGSYFEAIKQGRKIVVKTRSNGSFNIVPIVQEETLTDRICNGLKEVKMIRDGKLKGKNAEDLLNEL